MATRASVDRIAFRCRPPDSTTGVTGTTAKRLAEQLGVDETQFIHLALRKMALELPPQYAADDAPLTAAQVWQIMKRVPQGTMRSVRSSQFDAPPA